MHNTTVTTPAGFYFPPRHHSPLPGASTHYLPVVPVPRLFSFPFGFAQRWSDTELTLFVPAAAATLVQCRDDFVYGVGVGGDGGCSAQGGGRKWSRVEGRFKRCETTERKQGWVCTRRNGGSWGAQSGGGRGLESNRLECEALGKVGVREASMIPMSEGLRSAAALSAVEWSVRASLRRVSKRESRLGCRGRDFGHTEVGEDGREKGVRWTFSVVVILEGACELVNAQRSDENEALREKENGYAPKDPDAAWRSPSGSFIGADKQ
ncbi:hypothetical protein R3P38DRAFT_2803575 [Favolaschia claudopus]|uniref:Uncharacterized protein n=1 Tax=Favolaschia claudopus TaxID=2862362 RepID=A0AAV9ZT33_9AGAR